MIFIIKFILIIDFKQSLRQNKSNGRDYLIVAPKEQPPRKLSGKRTVSIANLWKEMISHRRSKSLRCQYRWGKLGT